MNKHLTSLILLTGIFCLLTGAVLYGNTTAETDDSIDYQLQLMLAYAGIKPLNSPPDYPDELVELGRLLFFDKQISGNRDTSCATCHHPLLATVDGLPLSIGTGHEGLGTERLLQPIEGLIPRNVPELFNRGQLTVMFWDGRLQQLSDGTIITPAGDQTPEGLPDVVTAQSIFPITSRDEMRGQPGDLDIYGDDNDLADVPDYQFTGIWSGVMDRLLAHDEYVALFDEAFPGREPTITHVARALGAFQISAFSTEQSAWNRYLQGDQTAISVSAKQGALLFYGRAGCADCHQGTMMTDEQFHNIAIPQMGPGKGMYQPLDYGRYLVTGDDQDRFAFRTPSLHNVALTAPYMHNGTFTTLEQVIRHKMNIRESLRTYTGDHLPPLFQETLHDDADVIAFILATVDSDIDELELSDDDVDDLIAFLESLTDMRALQLSHLIPERVPGGLPVQQ